MSGFINLLSHESVALAIIIGCGVLYIVSNARFGIIEPHSWRQADVYAHILGFTGSSDIPPFTTFDGNRVMFDVPIYQLFIAIFARLTDVDALIVTRFVNAGIWVVFVVVLAKLGDRFHRGAGVIAAGLISVSPLMLHFWSVPIPDILALTFALIGFYLAIDARYYAAAVSFGCAAFIKSPIPFIALVGLIVYLLLAKPDRKKLVGFVWISLSAFAGTVLAEVGRRALTPPTAATSTAFSPRWYFGYLGQRKDLEVYQSMLTRLTETFPGGLPTTVLCVLAGVGLVWRGYEVWKPVLACTVSYVIGWIVFPVLYQRHEYYALPGATFAILGVAVAISVLVARTSTLNFALAVFIPLCMVFTPKMSERDVANFNDAIRYAFRDQREFVVVENYVSGPGWGGQVGKTFVRYDTEDFQSRCEALFPTSHAFITVNTGPSCLDGHIGQVQTRIVGPDGAIAWVFAN